MTPKQVKCPQPCLSKEDIKYLVSRLLKAVSFIRNKEYNMATAKLLADIAALKSTYSKTEKQTRRIK